MSKQVELRQDITNRLMEAMQKGLVPWRRPWSGDARMGAPMNIASKKLYRGINPLLLGITAFERGYVSRYWGTFKQWSALGASVKARPATVEPGHWGTPIVFYSPITKTVEDADGARLNKFFVLRSFTVFNLDQVEGESVDKFRPEPDNRLVLPDYAPAEAAIEATKAEFRYGGEKAFYVPPTPVGSWPKHTGGDYIQMPYQRQFVDLKSYYETKLHELAHWAEVRVDWKRDRSDATYALGELIAEISACFLAAELGVPQADDLKNHESYLKSWLKAMKADYNFIFQASSQASKTTDYILSFSRPKDEKEQEAEVDA